MSAAPNSQKIPDYMSQLSKIKKIPTQKIYTNNFK